MDRKSFISSLSILTMVGILGCKPPTSNEEEQFMGKAEGKSKTTGTVSWEVRDKNGNLVKKGTSKATLNQKGD